MTKGRLAFEAVKARKEARDVGDRKKVKPQPSGAPSTWVDGWHDKKQAIFHTCGFKGWADIQNLTPTWSPNGCQERPWTHRFLRLCPSCYLAHRRAQKTSYRVSGVILTAGDRTFRISKRAICPDCIVEDGILQPCEGCQVFSDGIREIVERAKKITDLVVLAHRKPPIVEKIDGLMLTFAERQRYSETEELPAQSEYERWERAGAWYREYIAGAEGDLETWYERQNAQIGLLIEAWRWFVKRKLRSARNRRYLAKKTA